MKFNKMQRTGLFVLIVLIVILQFVIAKVDFVNNNAENDEQRNLLEFYNKQLDSLQFDAENKKNKKEYFKFNPNILSYDSWSYLGLSTKQLYRLDSFKLKGNFTTSLQVKNILKLNDSIFNIIDTLMYFSQKSFYKENFYQKEKINYLYFDPNKFEAEDWKQYGFSEKQAKIIVSYKNKIGGFKKANDLKEVFVINEKKYLELESYIQIADNIEDSLNSKIISLNTATAEDFKKIKGIGEVYSKIIVDYREKLGGFVYYYQLKETKIVDSLLYETIKTTFSLNKKFKPRTININKATLDQLKSHPYISWRLAEGIVEFRENFRDFESLGELKNIEQISDAYFDKIKLYLTVK